MRAAALAVAVSLAACGGVPAASSAPSASPDFATGAARLSYDASAPLDVREQTATGATSKVSFASPRGGRVTGILVTPAAPGPFAGIVLVPGSNQPPESFGLLAEELAARGAVALVIDQSQTRSGHPLYEFTLAELDEFVHTAIDVRRAVDVLVARNDVDSGRLGYWGFSHGAFIGGLVAGVERRIGAYVLRSGGGADYLRTNAPRRVNDPKALAAYLDGLAALDPNLFVAHASPSAVYLQNGKLDPTYTAAGVAAWQAAASKPKKISTYDQEHTLTADANADAFAWLKEHIGLR